MGIPQIKCLVRCPLILPDLTPTDNSSLVLTHLTFSSRKVNEFAVIVSRSVL